MHRSSIRSLCLVLGAATGLVLSTAPAQAKWTQLKPTKSPVARGNAFSAADPVNLYLFGGNSSGTVFYNDLWTWRVNQWTQLTADGAAGSPSKRRWGAACFDFARQELVLFSGQDVAKSNLGDTWVYSSGKWTQKTPAIAPSARRWAAMAYDWTSNRVLLFGGYGTANLNDTWAWNGSTWTKLSPKTSPPIKSRMGMVSLPETKEILMYGGTTTTSTATPTSEMWKWDGSDWSKVTQSGGPTSGVAPGMVYDEVRQRVVFYGGHLSYPRSDTWEWDGKKWTQRAVTGPGPRSGPGIGYLKGVKKTVLFGGYSGKLPMMGDTWEYQTDKLADFTTSGTGCTSGTQVPALTASGMPWLGGSLDVAVGVPAGSTPVMLLGISSVSWNGTPLPFNLGFFGNPSCNLLTSISFVFTAGSVQLPIPNTAVLAGGKVHLQGLLFDTGLALSATNLGTATLGVR